MAVLRLREDKPTTWFTLASISSIRFIKITIQLRNAIAQRILYKMYENLFKESNVILDDLDYFRLIFRRKLIHFTTNVFSVVFKPPYTPF